MSSTLLSLSSNPTLCVLCCKATPFRRPPFDYSETTLRLPRDGSVGWATGRGRRLTIDQRPANPGGARPPFGVLVSYQSRTTETASGYRIWIGSRPGTPLNRVLHQEKQHRTGFGVTYRGAQQVLPGCPTSVFVRLPATRDGNPHKQAEVHPCSTLREPTGVPNKYYRGAQQVLPGCPAKTTGVPDKYYRGAQQILPGCPTSTTGAPNKYYRGAQQVALRNMLQNVTFCLCS